MGESKPLPIVVAYWGDHSGGDHMDLITFRFIERGLAVIIGGIAVFLGYRLFLKIPESHDSAGQITLPWNITVILSRVGPGVFFALFGAGVVAFSLYKGLEISEKKSGSAAEITTPATGAASESREFKWGAAPTLAVKAAAHADARALLRRDIGILNNVTNSLRPDLPEHERTPIVARHAQDQVRTDEAHVGRG